MKPSYKHWQKLFFCCLGLAAGTAFCMKWMEDDLWQNGEKFTIVGLELSYSKNKIMTIFSGLELPVKTILRYHLSFDFAYMAGVFPGIAALCMMAREKSNRLSVRRILITLAALQTLAWGCDIYENIQLLNWIRQPLIGNEFAAYHVIVWIKWIIAVFGILVAIPFLLRGRKR